MAAAASCFIVATLVLIGWTFDIRVLKSVLPHFITMKVNTALGFILGALALVGFSSFSGKVARAMSGAAALGMGLIGLLTLLQQIIGVDFGIDQLLFHDIEGRGGRFPPGQLAPITAVNFIFLCLSFLLLHLPRKPYYKLGQFAAFIAFVNALQAMIGYIFGMTYIFGPSFYTQMALHTAGLFCALSVGILALHPEQGFMKVFQAEGAQSRISRILFAGALFLAPLLNVFYLMGQRAGYYDEDFGVLLKVVGHILIFSSLVLWSSSALYEAEKHRNELDRKSQKLERQLEALLTHAPVIVFTLDHEGKYTDSDGKGLAALDRKPGEAVGRSIYEVYKDDPWVLGSVARAYAGESLTTEGKIKDRAFELHLAPYRDKAHGPLGVIGLAIDNTVRRQAEEEKARSQVREQAALEASRLKSSFLANMSHEIRTPIHGVLGMTSLLLDTELKPEQKQFVEAAQRSGEALLTVINDILDFSKIEAGKLDFESISFHLNQALSDAVLTLKQAAQSKGLSLRIVCAEGLPDYVEGDAGRLRQVLSNLLSNAIKFSQIGEISLEASQLAREGQVAVLRFAVADKGIGIGAAARQRLFQPFTQADGSTTRLFGGTGLGLSICRHLVERMGGEIGVESEEGQGSTFWFTVRLRVAEKFSAHPREGHEAPVRLFEASHRSLRILVAEDVLINQIIAKKYLEKMGFSVEIAGNGFEALELVQKRSFDLVLMDCHMPDMDGYQATAAIRKLAGETFQSLPIIAMTANAMKGDMEKCLAAGMNDYLSKPIKAEVLAQNLRKWIPVLEKDPKKSA